MKSSVLPVIVLTCALLLPAGAETVSGLESYGDLTLVDSVECATDSAHVFHEYPSGNSYATNILGSACRAMEHVSQSASYFSFRLGEGKNLVPGDMYLLVAEYPDDAPRTATLLNRAMDSRNGFHTGVTVGDTVNAHIIPQTHCESLSVPLSGEYRSIEQLMILNENVYPCDSTSNNDFLDSATDGFDVVFQLFSKEDAPDSRGVAIRALKLYKVNSEEEIAARINYPAGAPRRMVTWREEMSQESGYAMNADRYQNARIKTRLMKALGVNCFSRDMLEFGYNQWWDVTCGGKYSLGDSWYRRTEDYYTSELAVYGEAGVYLMPYYEYSGSRGTSGLGYSEYRKAVPLFDSINTNTHLNKFVQSYNGAAGSNVDLTDPAAYEDFRRVLDCTIVRYKDQANFVGAWIRNRGSMPVSFSDNALERFCRETGRDVGSVTRASILAAAKETAGKPGMSDSDVFRNLISMNQQPDIYKEYRAWWYGKRADFLSDMQLYMETNSIAGAKVFFSGVPDEAGLIGKLGDYYNQYDDFVACQDADAWRAAGGTKSTKSIGVAGGYEYPTFFLGMDEWTWYPYEYNHAAPKGDPQTYTNRTNVAITYPYNTIYTSVTPGVGDQYRNGSGDLFFSRHFCLYEGCGNNASDDAVNGYFTCEMDRADRASMLPELYAVAYQDPTVIGFLQGNHLARNFPSVFREFNENFLSLPAVKGRVLQGGGWGNGDVTIRKYEVDGEQYYAVVNLSSAPVASAWHYITDDNSVSKLYETVSGTEHAVGSGYMRYELEPYQLLCFSTVKPGTAALSASISSSNVTESSATVSVALTAVPEGETATVTLRYWAGGCEDAAVTMPSQSFTGAGTATFTLSGLADGTLHYAEATVADGVSKPITRTSSFTTVAMAAPVFGESSASVSTNGTSAVISVTVTEVTTKPATLSLLLGSRVLASWDVSEPGSYDFTAPVVPCSTNGYSFIAVAGGRTNVLSGTFESRVYTEWFRVEFGSGSVVCDGTWTLPATGTAELALTNGVNAYVFKAVDELRYVPSAPSESGANVDVKGRVMVCSGSAPASVPEGAKAGLYFDGPGAIEVYGYGANGWRPLAGAPALTEGEWVDYAFEFDLGAQTVTYSIGGNVLTPAQPLPVAVDQVNAVQFSGSGAISNFRGAYYSMQAVTPPIEIIKPVFDGVGGGISSGTRDTPQGTVETFSLTITNPVKGAYYTVFTAETLPGPFHADSDSVRYAEDLSTLTFTVDADTPAKFLRIVASDEPFAAGDEL